MDWYVIFRTWAPLAGILVNLAITALCWAATRASKAEVQALDKRIAAVEKTANNAPGWGYLARLKDDLAELTGQVEGLSSRVEGLHVLLERTFTSLDLIQRHLLEHGK